MQGKLITPGQGLPSLTVPFLDAGPLRESSHMSASFPEDRLCPRPPRFCALVPAPTGAVPAAACSAPFPPAALIKGCVPAALVLPGRQCVWCEVADLQECEVAHEVFVGHPRAGSADGAVSALQCTSLGSRRQLWWGGWGDGECAWGVPGPARGGEDGGGRGDGECAWGIRGSRKPH